MFQQKWVHQGSNCPALSEDAAVVVYGNSEAVKTEVDESREIKYSDAALL
jgi:hypothetical protein